MFVSNIWSVCVPPLAASSHSPLGILISFLLEQLAKKQKRRANFLSAKNKKLCVVEKDQIDSLSNFFQIPHSLLPSICEGALEALASTWVYPAFLSTIFFSWDNFAKKAKQTFFFHVKFNLNSQMLSVTLYLWKMEEPLVQWSVKVARSLFFFLWFCFNWYVPRELPHFVSQPWAGQLGRGYGHLLYLTVKSIRQRHINWTQTNSKPCANAYFALIHANLIWNQWMYNRLKHLGFTAIHTLTHTA